jgi:feruloyl esterase
MYLPVTRFAASLLRRWALSGALLHALLLGAAMAPVSGAIAAPALAVVAPRMQCADLLKAGVSPAHGPAVQLSSAAEVRTGTANPYCKVEGVIAPDVRFEVRLPLAGWTQRYLQTGCGGLCGSLDIRVDKSTGCVPAESGELVLASTDMGHQGQGGAWADGNLQARVDFGYRGVHVTAVAAKALVSTFYGQGPRYSYFSGCSDGGREALMEAQRYPGDFNGIAAGAPALNFSVQNSFYHAWNALSNTAADGKAILHAAQLPILHAAAVASCDAVDGLKDGLIEDPRRCAFDPSTVLCQSGHDQSTCLSAAQVDVARKIYGGARDATGRKLVVGGPMVGSELAWAGVYVPRGENEPIFSAMIAGDSVQHLYYEDPLPASWNLTDLKFDEATLASFSLRKIYDATNPDLARFRKAGGKLVIWHGWSDPHISPLNSIAYYSAARKLAGPAATDAFLRLFLLPGMYHCGGGEGPSDFDVLSGLMAWVEQGNAPTQLLARSRRPDKPPGAGPAAAEPASATPFVDRARPVFAYPRVARFSGHGNPDEPGEFTAAMPSGVPPAPIDWLGAKYMIPGLQKDCDVVAGKLKCIAAR